jgi:hypothetical protein
MTATPKPRIGACVLRELFRAERRLPIGPTRSRFVPRPRPALPLEDKPGGCPPIRTL